MAGFGEVEAAFGEDVGGGLVVERRKRTRPALSRKEGVGYWLEGKGERDILDIVLGL